MKRLSRKFFYKNSINVAKQLLGKILVRKYNGKIILGKIVEVESYRGKDDPASHAFRNKTKKNYLMFGKPGIAYIYLCYGKNYLLNIITEKEGMPGAVLIRAVEPIFLNKSPKVRKKEILTNGPGKLTRFFKIDKSLNGEDIIKSKKIFIIDSKEKPVIKATYRIGIKKGKEKKWRFYIKNNIYVSKN